MIKRNEIVTMIKFTAIILLLLVILKGIGILILLILLSFGISFIINNLQIKQIGIELVTLIAVLSGHKYGPWIALAITFILISYHIIAGGFFGNYILWVIPAYCLAALISGYLPFLDLTQLGIYVTLAINMINIFFTALTNPTYLPRYLPYPITNIIFNIFLFTILVPPLSVFIK